MKKILGLAVSGVMVLGLTAAVGAPVQASETSARQQQDSARPGDAFYRYRVHTRIRTYSWDDGAGAGVLVYRYSRQGHRKPLRRLRTCLQIRVRWGGFMTVQCKYTNHRGRVGFRVHEDDWDNGARARGQRPARQNWSRVYRIHVPPTHRTYRYYSHPFRLSEWDDDNGDDD